MWDKTLHGCNELCLASASSITTSLTLRGALWSFFSSCTRNIKVMFAFRWDPLLETLLHVATSGQKLRRVPLMHDPARQRENLNPGLSLPVQNEIFSHLNPSMRCVLGDSKWKSLIHWVLVKKPQCYCKCQLLVYVKMLQNIIKL